VKVLLVINKTLSNGKTEWKDGGYYNVFLPLKDLGHEVYFYDTVKGDENKFSKIVDSFKPEIIFCCMTGDPSLTPNEPWEEIVQETKKGNCKTFNWFCDDTWRFNNFSGIVCKHFTVCSTTEPSYVEKFKGIGYDNIIIGGWHTNHTFYPTEPLEKKYDISFIGQINNPDRTRYISFLRDSGLKVHNFHGLNHKEMLQVWAETKIGINFSKNFNGQKPRFQMKLRPFEIAAAKDTLVLSEHHKDLEHFFNVDKEIVCFKNPEEMVKKASVLLEKDNIRQKIARNGNSRFISQHSSHERMGQILQKITDI